MKDEEIRKIIQRIKDNPELAKEVYFFLVQYFAEKSDLKKVLESLQRFQEMSERRFEALMRTLNEHSEENNQRFEQVDQRFEQIDQEFKTLRQEMNERFERNERTLQRVENMLRDLHSYMGSNFEGLVWTFVNRELISRGFESFTLLRNARFVDKQGIVHIDSTIVELDIFSARPLVAVEVTGILQDLNKVDKFIRKVQFIRQLYPDAPEGLMALVTTDVDERIVDEAFQRLQAAGIELLTRQEIQERLANENLPE